VDKAAIRATFEPLFKGERGKMQFSDEDIIIDADAGKIMAAWRLALAANGKSTSMRGLDILHFRNGKLTRKAVYAKTKEPQVQEK
jgi:ketosteroid isomerase-like protein